MRRRRLAVVALLSALAPGCGSTVVLSSGLTGVLAADGPTFGEHSWKEGQCELGSAGRSVILRINTQFERAELEVSPDPAEDIDVRFPWSHVRLKRADCTRFDVRVNSEQTMEGRTPGRGFVHLACRWRDRGDHLSADLTFRGCSYAAR